MRGVVRGHGEPRWPPRGALRPGVALMGRIVSVPKWNGSGEVKKRVPDDILSAWPIGTGGGTRFQLAGPWFIDHEPRMSRRHRRDRPYTLWESGGDPSGGAAERGSAATLDEM